MWKHSIVFVFVPDCKFKGFHLVLAPLVDLGTTGIAQLADLKMTRLGCVVQVSVAPRSV